jgi:hypothetical protein
MLFGSQLQGKYSYKQNYFADTPEYLAQKKAKFFISA